VWLRFRVRCGSDLRVRCGSDEGAVWLRLGCGVAQIRVRCGSDSSAPVCCTAGPGPAPQWRPSIKYCMSARLMQK
jgi:hypothetical protein